jgi:OOP family OmpA-OmpF porin
MDRKVSHLVARSVICLVSAFGAGTASADGVFVGLGGGEVRLRSAEDVLSGTQFDDSDTGFKLYGGYQIDRYFAVELAYADLGTFVGRSDFFGLPLTDTWEASALSISLTGSAWLSERFALFAKVGVSYWRVDDSDRFGGFALDTDASGADLSYGVGAEFDFTHRFGLRLEYDGLIGVGDAGTNRQDDAEVDMLSLSAVFRWGHRQ